MPKKILYIANTFIGFVFKNSMNFSTTINATMNDMTNPIIKAMSCGIVIVRSDFKSANELAAIIVGIAKKKENSAAAMLDSPKIQPPIIVAAERENPGNKIDKH